MHPRRLLPVLLLLGCPSRRAVPPNPNTVSAPTVPPKYSTLTGILLDPGVQPFNAAAEDLMLKISGVRITRSDAPKKRATSSGSSLRFDR